VDPFALVLLVGIVGLVLAVWLLGRFYPGSGLEQLGLRSAREIMETREALEAEDLDQMLAAHNARRRARGERELSADELEARVASELAEQRRRSEVYRADRETDELRELLDARRRERSRPELETPDES
jgi:hypothetical protein